MAANPRSTYISIDDYFAGEAIAHTRSEYRDGEILGMAGGTLDHSQIIQNLTSWLDAQLESQKCRVLGSEILVRVSPSRYYYPDVTIFCGTPQLEKRHGIEVLLNPLVVVEVLSPSTENRDRREKRLAYMQNETIQEVLLVTQEEPYVERLRRLPDGNWALDTITGIENVLTLTTINALIPLHRLYRFIFSEP